MREVGLGERVGGAGGLSVLPLCIFWASGERGFCIVLIFLHSRGRVGLDIAYELGRAYEQPVGGYSSDYSSTMIPLGCCCFTTTAAQSDPKL